ncbi:hypothetical protein [Streptomyces sp.]|uniref:hypothetical protein n=1 Tax=Streptomyces sp. TaxID=1931 RepID=UPI002F9301AE
MEGAYSGLRRWAIDATWESVFAAPLAQADTEGDLDLVVAVDSPARRRGRHQGPRVG